MTRPSDEIPNEYDDLLKDVSGISDADLERLMGGGGPAVDDSLAVEELEMGTLVGGTVVEVRDDEVLVELDGKNLGIIEVGEFEIGEVPRPGAEIQAEFIRYDQGKDVSILSVQTVRTEVLWEGLKVGSVLSGTVVDKNKGGLTLDIKGVRAFVPISQIELTRVEDLDPYIGRQLECEVMEFDRRERNLVLSRRRILEAEAAVIKAKVLEELSEGDIVTGSVSRLTDHGAFIDLGGVDGLLHMTKIRQSIKSGESDPLRTGQKVTVQIATIDRDRERIGLDFHQLAEDSWDRTVESYSVGDTVTGWVSRLEAGRTIVRIDEGLEAEVPDEFYGSVEAPSTGSIVRGRIVAIDRVKREIRLKPLPDR